MQDCLRYNSTIHKQSKPGLNFEAAYQMNEIMTAQELSAYLKITTTTIYKLAQQGEIPSFKVGSEWRFKKELVDRWLEKGVGNSPKKVLVVDDEPAICELYQRALDQKNIRSMLPIRARRQSKPQAKPITTLFF